MSRKFMLFAVAFFAVTASVLSMSQAKASEWGCEVLLCAASSNPSWQGIPFCQPPMTKLIACLSATNPCSWPQCTQAGTGNPGYQPYENCPAGWTPSTNLGGRDGNGGGVGQCQRRRTDNSCAGRDCDDDRYEYIARTRKANPYFFNIKDDTTGQVGKHEFNLRR